MNRKVGGGKALHCFVDKGLSKALGDSFSIYAKYQHSYTCVHFPSLKEVIEMIHEAKGKAILAHPGKVLKVENLEEFRRKLAYYLDHFDLDGVECCLELCRERKLLMTCICDCHGDFEEPWIGQLKITEEMPNIKAITQERTCHRSFRAIDRCFLQGTL